jgi:hypothetical protein
MISFFNWLESAGLVGGDPTNASLPGTNSKTTSKDKELYQSACTKSPECKFIGDCSRDKKKTKRALAVEI